MKNPLTKEVTEDFWYDCFNEKEEKLKNEFIPYKNYSRYYRRNINNKKLNNNNPLSTNLLSHENKTKKKSNNPTNKINNKTIDNENLSKIYKNHQILKENLEPSKIDKELELRKKNAMMRCLGLYAYGVEVKKAKLLNDENNKKEKVKDEMSHCTFKPKISKYSKIKQAKFIPEYYNNKNNTKENIIINSNGDYKISNSNTNTIENGETKKNNKINKKTIYIDDDDCNDLEQCTFKPKISKKNIKRVFGKSKSLANEKDNAEFILRYTRARQEYMIKKLKKLSTKDDSYSTTLLTLANRLNSRPYRNGGNELYENKMKNNKKINLSMDYKDMTLDIRRQNNIQRDIINNLRNDLLDINLNDEE